VFFNRNLTVSTKVAVYKAICLSILLYGCESWIPYRRHIKALEAYYIRCLQSIHGNRHSLVVQEDTYRNTWDCQNWIR